MRKVQPIELDISITDKNFLQDRVNSIFIEIVKYNLENSSASRKEKISYIDTIIKNLKSG